MVVCANCKKEMSVKENGVGVRFGKSHVYPGDLYECKKCKNQIILNNSVPVHDPEEQIKTIQMDEK